MNTYSNPSGPSSVVNSISDLDGYTIRDYNFPLGGSFQQPDADEFGFDPPEQKTAFNKGGPIYTPPEMNDNMTMSSWPTFENNHSSSEKVQTTPGALDTVELDNIISQRLPNTETAMSRFGQVTPPRSNSTPSTLDKEEDSLSPRTAGPERRKRSKPQQKEQEPAPTATTGRKRKPTKKASTKVESVESPEDSKRKQSLEKNRLAAAKCRVNKKEKTEQLQRDSHDKAVHNAFLKEQVMRMKEEVQQMNALLLAHASCDGCKSPDEIQKHLNNLGQEFFANHMSMAPSFVDYSQMQMGNMSDIGSIQDDFFPMSSDHDSSLLNPPLPEFNRTAEFEVHTPMQTD